MATWYRTGTADWTNGSPNVVGHGSLWLTQAQIGDAIFGPDGEAYEIFTITDDTHLSIKQRTSGTAAYAGATLATQPYSILRNFTNTLPAALASQLADLMTKYHVTLDELTAWLSGVGNVTVHDSAGNAYSLATPAALAATSTGYLAKSVAGGANVTLNATEAANRVLVFTGTLTANINVVLPLTAGKDWIVYNNTSGAFSLTMIGATGTGTSVVQGGRMGVTADGTNIIPTVTTFNDLGIGRPPVATATYGSLLMGGSAGTLQRHYVGATETYSQTVSTANTLFATLAGDQIHNVPTGKGHYFTINGVNALTVTPSGMTLAGAPIIFSTSAVERGRLTTQGYFKFSDNGTYSNSTSTAHEFSVSSNNNVLVLTNTHATDPYGPSIYFGGGTAPNNTTNYFWYMFDTGGLRAKVVSNGGFYNFSANNVNLSDGTMKTERAELPDFFEEWMKIDWFLAKYNDQTHGDWNVSYEAQNIMSTFLDKAPWLVDLWNANDPRDARLGVYDHDLRNIQGAVLAQAQRRIVALENACRALENACRATGIVT